MKPLRTLIFCLSGLAMMGAPAFPEGKAGLQDPKRFVQEEDMTPDPAPGMGTREIPGEDGGKDKIYYSVTTPEEEKKAGQEEKEKLEKSWDSLRNIVIDRRRGR